MADHPSTPLFQLEDAWKIGREAGLKHVYVGNAQSALGNNTYCPDCGAVAIERRGFHSRVFARNGKCQACGAEIAGVWK